MAAKHPALKDQALLDISLSAKDEGVPASPTKVGKAASGKSHSHYKPKFVAGSAEKIHAAVSNKTKMVGSD